MKYDTKKLLFSELVYLKEQDEKNADKYYKEIFDRLMFCGFDEKLSKAIIDYEVDILKKNKFKLVTPFIEQKYWLNEHFVSKLDGDREKYGAFDNPDGPTKDTLCTSELVFLDDEMGYVLAHPEAISNKAVLEEIHKFMPNDNDPWLQNEFCTRINFYNWQLNQEPKNKDLKLKELAFLRNEQQILFVNKYDYYEKTWEPYSPAYFELYDK